jgi:preprotein translocase subunit YajC
MANPTNVTECSNQEGGFFANLLQGPMFILIVFAILMIVMNFIKDRKEKKAYEEMKTNLSEGKTVRLRDDTVGKILNIDLDRGTIIIDSAGTKLEKVIDSVLIVFPENSP